MPDLTLLERRIDKLYAETAVVPGAVDLMTIHGAKGLEWDVVLVPGLEKKARVKWAFAEAVASGVPTSGPSASASGVCARSDAPRPSASIARTRPFMAPGILAYARGWRPNDRPW